MKKMNFKISIIINLIRLILYFNNIYFLNRYRLIGMNFYFNYKIMF